MANTISQLHGVDYDERFLLGCSCVADATRSFLDLFRGRRPTAKFGLSLRDTDLLTDKSAGYYRPSLPGRT